MKILTIPNTTLSQKANNVKNINKSLLSFIKEMKITLNKTADPVGVGLAACQVGNPISIFIMKPTTKSQISVFINPKIINKQNCHKPEKKTSKNKNIEKLEGCLSIPTIWGTVKRSDEITVEFMDEFGKQHTNNFEGFKSIIIQHEIDHLNGILFTHRVLEQKGELYKSSRNKNNEEIFEKIEL